MPDTDRFEVPPPWRTCTETDCQGKQLSSADGRCFAHASDDERAEALAMLSAGAPLDFAAGVHFTDDRLVELLAALPRDAAEHWILQQADFAMRRCLPLTFKERASRATPCSTGPNFQGDAVFDGANFQGVALFTEASFHGDAGFTEASFLRALESGLMLVNGRLALDGIVLEHPVQLQIAAVELSCRRMRFSRWRAPAPCRSGAEP